MKRILLTIITSAVVAAALSIAWAGLLMTGCGKKAVVQDKGKVYAELKEDDWSKVDQVKAQVLIQNPNVKWVEILRKKEDNDVKEIVGHETDPPDWAKNQRQAITAATTTPTE
jgi:hypothetical protein